MYAEERQQAIASLVINQGRASVAELAETYDVTTETVRRDLAVLDRAGLVRRVHGGAVPVRALRLVEPGVGERENTRAEHKDAIAAAAAEFFPLSGASVLLDAGTTTSRIAAVLPTDRELNVVTNSVPIAARLAGMPSVSLQLLGGRVRGLTQAAVGEQVLRVLDTLRVDIAFIGTNGISLRHGLSTPDPEEAAQDTVLRHVLDAVRGGDTPDVVPASSSVAGFAEFLAVDAVLDKRWPETKMEPSLDRIRDLVELLGDPQRGYPVVHLTGTNGKTSTSRLVDALLSEIGLRTGRYTSPHLQSATERINIDNRPITPERYVEVYRDVAPFVDLVDARHDIPLSKFEVLTAMAFAAFADAPVEAGIVEVGLGGRWDATNVVDGTVAVVTPIGLDHAEYLGTDILGIAREKAGIIKPGAVAVLSAQERGVAEVLIEHCVEVGAQVAREGAEFGVRDREVAVGGQRIALQGLSGPYDDIFLPLHGEHQASNAAIALAAAEALAGAGPKSPLDPEAVRAAFAAVRSPGRLERVAAGADVATVLVDAAHNPHGARALAAALTTEFRFTRLIAVVAAMRD